jgi:murein DD-endopeptidase MepM/ murein hydrolase activator NlpD
VKAGEICRAPGAPRLGALLVVFLLAGGASWAEAHVLDPTRIVRPAAAAPAPASAAVRPSTEMELVWSGADVDGDGQPDFANPTGEAPRQRDSYGDGEFRAPRDGGQRRHEGVDYIAEPGQPVKAPMSGYVAHVGFAYPGDQRFHFVEIANPALGYTARVFYVDPKVQEGQAVHVGDVIGTDHSLQGRYPGITNHVHLEIARANGRRLDATRLITERYEAVAVTAGGPGPRVALK